MTAHIQFIHSDLQGALDIIDRFIDYAYERGSLKNVLHGWRNKGWFCMRGGNINHGINCFKTGIELLSKDEISYRDYHEIAVQLYGGLSLSYGEIGSLDSSKYYLNEAKSIYNITEPKEFIRSMMITIECAFAINQGDYDQAIERLSPIKYPGAPWRFYLAKAHELSGNTQLARKYYHHAMHQRKAVMTGFFYQECKEKLKELISPQSHNPLIP